MIKIVPRLVRADDFVAETYENMATNLPLSETELAGYYRRTAQMFRESTRTGMMRVWEREKAEFVESDPSSKR